MQPQVASAVTQAQKDTCLSEFANGEVILNDSATGAPTDKGQLWNDNNCGETKDNKTFCHTKINSYPVGPSVNMTIRSSDGCDASWPVTIASTPEVINKVKEGYQNATSKTVCGDGDVSKITNPVIKKEALQTYNDCVANLKQKVAECVDEYMANPPANAPEFPEVDAATLAGCVKSKVPSVNKDKLIAAYKQESADIVKAANQAKAETDKKTCEDAGGTWNSESSECGTTVTCNKTIEGIGWLVCPAMNFMAMVSDWAYTFIGSAFLQTKFDMSTADSPLRDSWARFRDVANVAFVIALLIVIYSQITSVGISNYGIKKMLPKIIISAILVNLSFTICAIAVDLSNILGFGVTKFFESLGGSFMKIDPSATTATTATYGLDNGLTYVGAIAAVGLAGVGIALGLSIPVLLSAILALGLIALILLARQALIVLLIVIAPLAFVAYLLPNTEQWFKKWVKMFSTLLLLFPIIGVVFGASRLAATVVYESGSQPNADGSQPIIMQIMALGVMAIPFFVVPGLLKGALNAAGAIGAKMSGWADKAGKMSSKGAVDMAKKRSQLYQTYQAGKEYKDKQRAIKLAKTRGTSMRSRAMGAFAGGKGYNKKARRDGSTLEDKEHEEEIKAATLSQANMSHEDKLALAADKTADRIEREAAIRYSMSKGSFDDRQAVLHSAGTMTASQRRSAVDGALEKGDASIYGSTTLGKIRDLQDGQKLTDASGNEVSMQDHMDGGTVKKINDGELGAEAATKDAKVARYVAGQKGKADAGARDAFDKNVKAYAATPNGQKIDVATRAAYGLPIN